MSQKRYAFLMGANGPQTANLNSLKYAERDAERLATALEVSPCAFTNVESMTAANREPTLTGLKAFTDQCEPSDLLLVHFSGHGLYDEQLYLICNGTDITNLDASAIGVDTVKRILRKCKARHKLLVLDCCYAGGAFSGAFRGEQNIEGVLSKELEGSASIILSACSRLERARELTSLDGGAGFLSWVLLASCTTRLSDVSPDHRSLTLMDIWRWIPIALAEVNASLGAAEQLPRPILISQLEAGTDGEIWLTEVRRDSSGRSDPDSLVQDREHFLKALLSDHSSFMRDRLDSFVGREKELAEIRQRIAEKQQSGGYVTITGQAGQGKSSIIARLIDTYQQKCGPEKIAFHFIPINSRPDHQVGLLRNLMARLILKYNLSDLYVASANRPVLSGYFPKVLGELAAQGGQEVIFIDGLDQLEAEHSGERDLSFLPNNPPPGVVFVLGTRPNDTLRPLELLKPRYEYQLPDLSREDFDLVLQHRNVSLDRGLADRFYAAMQGNALYLDLLAKELTKRGTTAPKVLIKQISDNPEHLFWLAMASLKRQPGEWREVIKPVLGVLLVAQEPLGVRHIRQILGVDDDRLREGMERLGGLIVRDWQQRYSLFHLKLYEYLRQDEQRPTKEYIFATDEEQNWHKTLANWCEQGNLPTIWQDVRHNAIEQQRREYARQHYVTHLYQAHEWQRLFEVLDTAQYGKARIGDDPSTLSYAQDLDLGRQAASWEGWTLEEGMALLPRMWRYTLLRCSLTSRADQYPLAAFQLLVLLKRKQEALGLAELLTDPANKVQALLQIAKQLREQSDQEKEWLALLLRAGEIARTIQDSLLRAKAVENLLTALTQAQQWDQAQAVIATIQSRFQRAEALRELATILTRAQQWDQAQAFIGTIQDSDLRAEALANLGSALAQAQLWDRAKAVWKEAQAVIATIQDSSWALWRLATALTQAQQWDQAQAIIATIQDSNERAWALRDLGSALAQAQQWDQAQGVIATIHDSDRRAWALQELATALAQAQQWDQAQAVWDQAQGVIATIHDSDRRAKALQELATALTQVRQWDQAQAVINTIQHSHWRADALVNLATALAQAQQWDQAQAVCKQAQGVIGAIQHSSWRADALVNLATALAQAQQWDQAQVVIGTIENSEKQADALVKLATALTQAQQWDQAQAVISTIQDFWPSNRRAKALANLITALIQAQQWDQAQAVINTIEYSYWQAETLEELATALIQVQQWDRAQAVWEEAQVVIATIQRSKERAEALVKLATALIQAQQWDQAQAVWEEAQVVIATIKDSDRQAGTLVKLATALIQTQQWDQAQAVIGIIVDNREQAWALRKLATTLAQAQQWKRAQAVWKEAQVVIGTIQDSEEQAGALENLATALTQAQQWDQAQAVIATIQDSKEQAWALRELATALAQAQQWKRAQAVWKEAQVVIGTIQDNDRRVEALVNLATALAQAQQWDQAQAVIGTIENSEKQAGAFAALGSALAQTQQWDQAQAIWKEARAVIGTIQRSDWRAEALAKLATALTQAQQWDQVQAVISMIEDNHEQTWALRELATALTQAQQWDQAQAVIDMIQDSDLRAGALENLAIEMFNADEDEALLHVIHRSWRLADDREYALGLFPMVTGFVLCNPELGFALPEAFTRVDSFFLRG
jgi:tetratricopeptide (TPR) repeat protein